MAVAWPGALQIRHLQGLCPASGPAGRGIRPRWWGKTPTHSPIHPPIHPRIRAPVGAARDQRNGSVPITVGRKSVSAPSGWIAGLTLGWYRNSRPSLEPTYTPVAGKWR